MEEAKIGTREAAPAASLERTTETAEQETMEEQEPKMEISDDKAGRVRDPIHSVCSSSALDHFLVSKRDLNVSYPVPRSGSLQFVSAATTDMPIMEVEPKVDGIMAGLGIKRKGTGMKDAKNALSKKPKTLSEKRVALEAEILKYGLATVEKMYPRQPPQSQMKYFAQRRLSSQKVSPKGSPIKMKPKPIGLDFEEVDARQILKPLSHDKYIREPAYDSVVYITRRNGIVPLSSLCKDSNTILSSNVKLLQGRNVRLGKPNVFLKDKDRLLALGGSRNKLPQAHSINIVKIPKLIQDRREKCIPFEMDNEYALFAVEALVAPSKKSAKVDIRTLKKQKKAEQSLSSFDKSPLLGKGIINHVFAKLQKANEMENAIIDESESDKDSKEEDIPDEIDKIDQDRKISTAYELPEHVKAADSESDVEEEADEATIAEDALKQEGQTVHNSWSASRDLVPAPLPDIENKPILTDDFKKKFEERKKNPVAGVDVCDVEDCFCKEMDDTTSTFPTGLPTPVSGSQTPSAAAQKESLGKDNDGKVKKNMKKVRRALKTLGVHYYEFDDSTENGRNRECTREFCRLGCVCDTIASKPVPPTHCGKVECMLKCFCSEDAVKFASSRKIGISPAGAANLRSNSQRHMAAEERKFHNTVVATTSGQDLVMLGSSGRQKRERKVPSRYQDSDTLMLEAGGKDYLGKASGGDIDDYIGTDPTIARLVGEGLRDNTMKKCAVVVPLIELPPNTYPWCMFHCQYSCPCSKLKNPLDYAPDKNVSRRSEQIIGVETEDAETPQLKKNDKKDIAPHERPGPKSSKIKSKDVVQRHCARTAGLLIKPSNKIRMPYKIVQSSHAKSAKKMNEKNSEGATESSQTQKGKENDKGRTKDSQIETALPGGPGPLAKVNTVAPKESRPGFGLITGVSTITPNSKFLGNFLEDTPPLNLSMQPKGSIQYARWNVLKQDLQDNKITVYCFLKGSRYVVFVARARESPYVTNAENIKTLPPARYKSLPPTVESLLSESSDCDLSRYAILTHNGIAWELTGVLQKKKPTEETKKRLPRRNEDMKGEVIAPSPQPLNSTAAVVIGPDTTVMKLPLGQSLVTMQRQGHQTMQIKLPTTTGNQHWCTIRVDNAEGTIQCPDSTMALKCTVLKQAATLSMKEETTVRIPIAVPGEVSSFGVYAVPGLSTHVFVGPFTNNNKVDDSEVICLDSPPPKDVEDEEVQVITPTATNNLHRRKQRLEKRVDNTELLGAKDEIVDSLIKDISDQAVSVGERKIRREAYRGRIITGQVPCVVENVDNDNVILIDSSDDEGTNESDRVMTSTFQMQYPKVPYLNMTTSDHGKTVIRSKAKTVSSNDESISFGATKITINKRKNGVVTFPHPKHPEHEVFCASLDDAKKWVQEYEGIEPSKEEKDRTTSPSKNAVQPPFQLQLKPLSSLVASESSCGKVLKRTQEIIHPDGRRGLAIFLDRQQQRETSKLYYNLGTEAFKHFFRKNISKIQILQKAKDEALYLCQQDKELQQIKKSLMLKRKKLFEDFTVALKGLPIEVKKQKLQELKNVVKKRDDSSQESRRRPENVLVTSEPLIHRQIDQGLLSLNSGRSIARSLPMPSRLQIFTPDHQTSSSAGGPTPYSDVTGLKTVKKDGKVLRPMNAFMLWAKDHRRTLIANGYDGATVSKMLAEEWKVLTDDHKQKYYHEAENLKGLHQLQHPNYKYSPRARKNTKRGGRTSMGLMPATHIQPKRIAPAPAAGFSMSGLQVSHNPVLNLGPPIRIPAPSSFLHQNLVAPGSQTMQQLQSSGHFQAPIMSNVQQPEIETISLD